MAVIAYGKYYPIGFTECEETKNLFIDFGEQQVDIVESFIDGKYYIIDGKCYLRNSQQDKTRDGDYPIHDVSGPYEDCYCGSEPPTPPEPPKPIIKKREGNIEYYEKINCEFADAVYNKAMSDRYGIEFCCEKDLQKLTIKKKLLDAGQLQDDIDLCLL